MYVNPGCGPTRLRQALFNSGETSGSITTSCGDEFRLLREVITPHDNIVRCVSSVVLSQ